MERRASARQRCHLVCQLTLDDGMRAGAVVDISKGGMRLLTDRPIDQGESVRVRFAPSQGKPLDVDTLVWHARRLGAAKFSIGLVLSEPSPDYLEAVDAFLQDAPRPDPARQAGGRAEQTDPEAEATFRLRARRRDSPRSRTLHVDAVSAEEACLRAREALGSEWTVIEARRA